MADDRRTRYTKNVIRQALLDLLKEKPITKITVTDICKLADINRSTFYSYYEDVYGLLELIQNDLFEDVIFSLSTDNWFDQLLGVVDKNRDLFSVLLGPNGDSTFIQQLMYLGYDSSVRFWKETYPNVPDVMLDYAYAHLSYGVIGIMENWVSSDYDLSIEQVGTILHGLTMNGLDFMRTYSEEEETKPSKK